MGQIERHVISVEQPADVRDARLRPLFELWDSRRRGRCMPARGDFLAEEFKAWMPNLVLYEVEGEASSFRLEVRLSGTAIVELDGADLTGRYLDELIDPARHPAIYRSYGQCIAARAARYEWADTEPHEPVYSVRRIPFRSFCKLLLPLSADDSSVQMMLVALYADFDPLVDGEALTLREAAGRGGLPLD